MFIGMNLTIVYTVGESVDESVDYIVYQTMSWLVHKLSVNGEKCQPVFPKVPNEVLQCLVLSTIQI